MVLDDIKQFAGLCDIDSVEWLISVKSVNAELPRVFAVSPERSLNALQASQCNVEMHIRETTKSLPDGPLIQSRIGTTSRATLHPICVKNDDGETEAINDDDINGTLSAIHMGTAQQ
jgi:hypothetical protein